MKFVVIDQCTTSDDCRWVSLEEAVRLDAHFGDSSFQTIGFTGINNQTQHTTQKN